VQALLAANEALGLPRTLGGLGSWYDGATFALESRTPALMYGPRAIDWAHSVGEHVAVQDLVHTAQGIAIAAAELCR
jgi:acetylornithine deacetylase/succinyl-diaminopimelate desuccinylase-like protein